MRRAAASPDADCAGAGVLDSQPRSCGGGPGRSAPPSRQGWTETAQPLGPLLIPQRCERAAPPETVCQPAPEVKTRNRPRSQRAERHLPSPGQGCSLSRWLPAPAPGEGRAELWPLRQSGLLGSPPPASAVLPGGNPGLLPGGGVPSSSVLSGLCLVALAFHSHMSQKSWSRRGAKTHTGQW